MTPTTEHVKCNEILVKNSGGFATEREAMKWAEHIRNCDARIDVAVVSMYEFLPVPIPPSIEENVPKYYADQRLDKIMDAQRRAVEHDRRAMEARIKRDTDDAHQRLRQAAGTADPNILKVPDEVKQYDELVAKSSPSDFDDPQFAGRDIAETMAEVLKTVGANSIASDVIGATMELLGRKKTTELLKQNGENERSDLMRKESVRRAEADVASVAVENDGGRPSEPPTGEAPPEEPGESVL